MAGEKEPPKAPKPENRFWDRFRRVKPKEPDAAEIAARVKALQAKLREKSRESPLADKIKNADIQDETALNFILQRTDVTPPADQLKGPIGAGLSHEVAEAAMKKVISKEEAVKTLALINTVYGEADPVSRRQIAEDIRRVVSSEGVNYHTLEAAVQTLGTVAAYKDVDPRYAEATVAQLATYKKPPADAPVLTAVYENTYQATSTQLHPEPTPVVEAGPQKPEEISEESHEPDYGNFYDPATDQIQDPKLADDLGKIQQTLNESPDLRSDMDWLRKQREELNRKYPTGEARQFREDLGRYESFAYNKYKALRQAEEPYSGLYLDEEIRRGLIEKNTLWEIEKILRRVEETSELFPDTPAARAASQTLDQVSGYIGRGGQFLNDVKAWAAKQNWASEEDKRQYLENMKIIHGLASQKINYRTKVLEGFGYMRGIGDPEKLAQVLTAFGEKGVEYILNEEGGLVQVAYDKFNAILEEMTVDENGHKRRIEGRLLKKAHERLIQQLRDEARLYDHTVQKDLKQQGFKNRSIKTEAGEEVGNKVQEADIQAAARLAEYLSVLTQREAVAYLKGLGPAESSFFSTLSSFAHASTTEKILASYDIERWFFRKWFNLDPGKRSIWENACELQAKRHGRDKYVNQMMGEKKWNDLVMDAFGFDVKDGKRVIGDVTKKNIEKFLEREKQRDIFYGFSPRQMWSRLNTGFAKVPERRITPEQLHRALMIKEGAKIEGRLLAMYDHFSSGWRLKTHLLQLGELFGKSNLNPDGTFDMREGYGDLLGLGLQMKRDGDPLYKVETDQERKAAIGRLIRDKNGNVDYGQSKGLLPTLHKVARMRPHALLNYLDEGQDRDAGKWFKDNKQPEVKDRSRLYFNLHQRFLAINYLLGEQGLPPIDYLKGPTGEQQRIIDKVCQQLNVAASDNIGKMMKPAEYTKLMQGMAKFAEKDKQLLALTDEKYFHIYDRTEWVDDTRLKDLENPYDPDGNVSKNLPGLDRTNKEKMVPISELFITKGMGMGDPLVRTWNDTALGVKTVQNVYDTLTPNKEKYFRLIPEIYNAIKTYNGSDPHASRAILGLAGGVGRALHTDGLYNLLMVGDLP